MRRAGGNTDRKRAAASHLTGDAHRTAVQFHQFLDERQTDSRSFVTTAARAFHAMKPFEEMREELWVDPLARIGDLNLRLRTRRAEPNLDLPDQAGWWTVGFAAFVVLTIVAACTGASVVSAITACGMTTILIVPFASARMSAPLASLPWPSPFQQKLRNSVDAGTPLTLTSRAVLSRLAAYTVHSSFGPRIAAAIVAVLWPLTRIVFHPGAAVWVNIFIR